MKHRFRDGAVAPQGAIDPSSFLECAQLDRVGERRPRREPLPAKPRVYPADHRGY